MGKLEMVQIGANFVLFYALDVLFNADESCKRSDMIVAGFDRFIAKPCLTDQMFYIDTTCLFYRHLFPGTIIVLPNKSQYHVGIEWEVVAVEKVCVDKKLEESFSSYKQLPRRVIHTVPDYFLGYLGDRKIINI